MGKAEDIVRARQNAEAQQAHKIVAQQVQTSQIRIEELLQAIELEIPYALARLERKGFPGGKLVRVKQGRFSKKTEMVGWDVHCGYHKESHVQPEGPSYITLCSSGNFLHWQGGLTSIRTLVGWNDPKNLEYVLNSLRNLGT